MVFKLRLASDRIRGTKNKEESFQGRILNMLPKITRAVDSLRNTDEGSELVKKVNLDFLPEKLKIPLHYWDGSAVLQNAPYSRGNIFVVSAVNRAIRELGYVDMRVAEPEDLMLLYRKPFNDLMYAWSDVCVVIYSDKKHNEKQASNLIKQAGLKKMDLPVVVWGLEAEIDPTYEHGVKLLCVENSGILKNAKAFLNKEGGYSTSDNLCFSDIAKVGDQRTGSIHVCTPSSMNYVGLKLLQYKGQCKLGGHMSTWFDYLGNLHGAGRVLLRDLKKKKVSGG
ncbi:hypothetical protein HOK51_02445 [Candidatus Woesearchaeota archaeon]|jgi:hypothetical protein|nr:hypothetical protein [Candidatus Woesearchaeota archaeon]MBT6518677.1 hypothetical protein [Candidatus Woesearchaeota archaeon]MBT7368867.1 hypothetical protein [Candidatus Woesearchaeota archaeon]